MAISNRDRVGKALDILKEGLVPFAEREFKNVYKSNIQDNLLHYMGDDRNNANRPIKEFDVAPLLKLMWSAWNDVYRNTLGNAERALVSELRDIRTKWAHQEAFSSDDAYRALDSAGRLLAAVSSPQASEIEKIKMELLRVRFDEQLRTEKRKGGGTAIESISATTLPPWREVINPHKDVASGRYQQAEFAADLWQVHMGEGTDEYLDPKEFYRRTFLTESLKQLVKGAIERVTGNGGDPVIQLQTNFGGGKTHSMLALYHLFSGTPTGELIGIDNIIKETNVKELPAVKRVVLVGNKISPGNPVTKKDGTTINTLWGELAWQLGGKEAYKRIKADDERATNPGDALRQLFNDYGPCLILIDEWVAYARQLHDQNDLPGGSFETQFSFAQALTESAKLADRCLLIISLPASDTAVSPHTVADDIEVGGQKGLEALQRLQHVIGRLESSWRPASAEEGFEIVRRRLFEPMVDRQQFVNRDNVAKTFFDMYRTQQAEFPSECREIAYEQRIKDAYPIHPEIFDRLYTDWSTLVKFQRTRGVLRLMASVIHSLWQSGDRNPLIMPANIPIDDQQRVQFELTRYLSDQWAPIIEKDVDGPQSLPARIDSDVPNLGKYHACRRVARTIYLGSAPITKAANQGLEDRRIKLGCVMPGESASLFGDALRRMASTSTYLYQDGSRYWYSTQPTVTKLAEDRAEQYKRDPHAVTLELEKRLRADLRRTGEFRKIHPLPQGGQDVPDDLDARLIVLGIDHPYIKDNDSPALKEAKSILETRGTAPRLYRNTLVFLAADATRLQELEEAIRRYLAWESIISEKNELDLSPFQVKQAETQKNGADTIVTARLPETYMWLLLPVQETPQSTVEWQVIKLTGMDSLAVRASRKLQNDDSLITSFGAVRLRMELDKVLWRGNHVQIKQLIEDFAKYIYLPRLADTEVLLGAIRDGVSSIGWEHDSFAYAEEYDEKENRYRGLRVAQGVNINGSSPQGLLVKSAIASAQLNNDAQKSNQPENTAIPKPGGTSTKPGTTAGPGSGTTKSQPTRFHGSVTLDPARVGRDAGRIADELISHLSSIMNAEVIITLEIEANVPGGVNEQVVRTVMENSKVLKFKTFGFEE